MLQVYTPRRILEQMIKDLRDRESAEMLRILARNYFIHSNCYTLFSNTEQLFCEGRGVFDFMDKSKEEGV